MKIRKILFTLSAATCIASAAIGAASAQAQPMPTSGFSLYATVNGVGQHEYESLNYTCPSSGMVSFSGSGAPLGTMYTENISGTFNNKTGAFTFSSNYSPGPYSWSATGMAYHDMMSDDMNFTASSFTGAGVASVTGTFVDVPPCSHGQYVSGARKAGMKGKDLNAIARDKSLFGPYPSN